MPDFVRLAHLLTALPQPWAAVEYDLGFKDWSAMPEVWRFFRDMGLATAAALALWTVARFVAARVRQARDRTAERIAAEALRVLRLAQDQRSKVELAMGTGKSTPCAILELNAEQLKLEAPAFAHLTPEAVGKTAECFFKISSDTRGAQWDFYRFRGPVRDLAPGRDRAKVVTLPLPGEVVPGQKRQFFRLSPPRQLVPRLAAWPESLARSSVRDLPKPQIRFTLNQEAKVHLVNISAGGLLLDGERRALVRSGLPLEPGKGWLFFLSVMDKANDERLDWWLTAALVNVTEGARGRIELAFRLTGFANALEHGAPAWEPIPEDGVAAIATWVFLSSMELVREGKNAE